MITGTITPDREAVLRLSLQSESNELVDIEAVLDTGFTDDLTLPDSIIGSLGLSLLGSMPAVLADGSVIDLGFCRATVLWDGRPVRVVALAAEGTPLVGMSLLYGSRLTMDIVDGGPVTIEGLA